MYRPGRANTSCKVQAWIGPDPQEMGKSLNSKSLTRTHKTASNTTWTLNLLYKL